MNPITQVYRATALFILTGIVLLAGANVFIAHAAVVNNTILVTSLADAEGTCPDAENCTLRTAIEQVNSMTSLSNTTITFSKSGTIDLREGSVIEIRLPFLASSLTIDGSGQSIVIDAHHNNQAAIFSIDCGSTTVITLNKLTFQNGTASPAVTNTGGLLQVLNSTFTNNSAGALDNTSYGTLLINNSIFLNNSADDGGAIYSAAFSHTTITDSTIYKNHADGAGGGIYNQESPVNISNTIIAGNTASEGGPDVYSTFISLGNNLIGDGNASSFLIDFNGTATASAAHPVANETSMAMQAYWESKTPAGYASPTATVTPLGFVLTATSTQPPIMQNSSSDQVGTAASSIDPMIGTSAGSGSPLYALLPGSPAIGRGDCTGNASVNPPAPAVTTDQQGQARSTPCTIGALEASATH